MVLVRGYYEYGAKTVSLASGEEQAAAAEGEEVLVPLLYSVLYRVKTKKRKPGLRRQERG